MYAIVQLGSEQFKVSEGDVITVDHLQAESGKKMALENVLMVSDGKDVKVGQPTVSGAKIEAQVLQDGLAGKVVAFKYWRRKAHAFKKGHRAKLTALKITKIKL